MSKTSIEWVVALAEQSGAAGETWNPVRGCTKVSAGCANCYAAREGSRWNKPGAPYEGLAADGKWTGQIRLLPEKLVDPLRARKRRVYFVNSMSDLFHPGVPIDFIDQVFSVMRMAPDHTFMVLTKRPERMLEYFESRLSYSHPWEEAADMVADLIGLEEYPVVLEPRDIPLPNVYLGVSIEDQQTADERIPLLLQTPAEVRFVSAEPLLGAVDLCYFVGELPEDEDGAPYPGRLHWVIAGGESGPKARPMHPDWARSLRDQCASAGTPFFFKQWGEWAPRDRGNQTHMIRTDGALFQGPIHPSDDGSGKWGSWKGVARIGKTAAGHLLDGVEHRQVTCGETGCSGDPLNCERNDGYGCECSLGIAD